MNIYQKTAIMLMTIWLISGVYLFFGNLAIIVFILMMSSLIFLGRTLLIILGLYKSPVLQSFERYGDDETIFFPYAPFLFWLGLFIFTSSLWFASLTSVWLPGELIGTVMILASLGVEHYKAYIQQNPKESFIYPRWLFDIQQRTSRLERRRIAYMWMRLPWRTRLLYNSNDQAFLQWADFVILSTLM